MSVHGPQGHDAGGPPSGRRPFSPADLLPPASPARATPTKSSSTPSPSARPTDPNRRGSALHVSSDEHVGSDALRTGETSSDFKRTTTLAQAAKVVAPRRTGSASSAELRGWHRSVEAFLRTTPPWLVSLLLHLLGLILLALLSFPIVVAPTLDIELAAAEQDEIPWLDERSREPPPAPVVISETVSSDLPLVAETPLPPTLDIRLEPRDATVELPTDPAHRALSGRTPAAKRALLAAYGGTAETESAVYRGLQWLVRKQRRSGRWSLTRPYADGGSLENETAATAMAMLALLGGGHTHLEGEFRQSVERGARALVKMQDAEGNFYHRNVVNHRLYSQAQATIAICELYAMTQDPQFRDVAQRALDYAVVIQTDDGNGGGGWRYVPGRDIDTSVTGWFVMALQSGMMAQLDVPEETLQRVWIYLDRVTEDGVHYRYRPTRSPSVSMTAEALLCRQYQGWAQDDSRLLLGAEHLLEHPIRWIDDERSVYYWYYATQVLHHLGGEPWQRWNADLRTVLPKHQRDTGSDRGSWDPVGDVHGDPGGRLYTTCLCICMLEVYYRHLPIYGMP